MRTHELEAEQAKTRLPGECHHRVFSLTAMVCVNDTVTRRCQGQGKYFIGPLSACGSAWCSGQREQASTMLTREVEYQGHHEQTPDLLEGVRQARSQPYELCPASSDGAPRDDVPQSLRP
jgi:hypothetical protein